MEHERGSREWWADVVRRFWARGAVVTRKEFARAEGVTLRALTYRAYRKQGGRKEPAQRQAMGADGEVRLVPVSLREGASTQGVRAQALAETGGGNWLEAETVTGLKLRFPVRTDRAYVAGLLLMMNGGSAVAGMGGGRC